jgi:uncharacterized damage-inducible protein DinB
MSDIEDRLTASRTALMTAIAGLDEQSFRARPGEGEWSTAHILAHLFIVESMALDKKRPFDDQDAADPESALVRRMTVPQVIHGLVAKRRANLQKLASLEEKGAVTVETIEGFAAHEEEHARNIADLREQLARPKANVP